MRQLALPILFSFAYACHRQVATDLREEEAQKRAAMRAPQPKSEVQTFRSLRRCFPEDASGDPPRPLETLLDRAAARHDHGDFDGALDCAEEAARVEPRLVEAHHDRAAALQELGRLNEARDAFQRALALDPEDAETLAGIANLYINHLPPSNDATETGLEYARRGTKRLRGNHKNRPLLARLALLEGQALNDLGRSREALLRLDTAADTNDPHVKYERGLALFELCQFSDAKKAFLDVLAKSPKEAWAHHHLGLTLERMGDLEGAERELTRAREEAPNDFRTPVALPMAEFREVVDAEVKKLPNPLRGDLQRVALEVVDLPDLNDLTAEEPPLAPTILGLFRGAPLGEGSQSEPRAIVLYRKNLERAVTSREDLVTQVRTTLYHELGHLRGEDDDALRARGLE
jgi:Flp pilus assembly protein TadD/predicted Zn-dependent protease with MMP-like domain